MESNYDYWWWKSLKTIKYIENKMLLHVKYTFNSLLKCAKNCYSAVRKLFKTFYKKLLTKLFVRCIMYLELRK